MRPSVRGPESWKISGSSRAPRPPLGPRRATNYPTDIFTRRQRTISMVYVQNSCARAFVKCILACLKQTVLGYATTCQCSLYANLFNPVALYRANPILILCMPKDPLEIDRSTKRCATRARTYPDYPSAGRDQFGAGELRRGSQCFGKKEKKVHRRERNSVSAGCARCRYSAARGAWALLLSHHSRYIVIGIGASRSMQEIGDRDKRSCGMVAMIIAARCPENSRNVS